MVGASRRWDLERHSPAKSGGLFHAAKQPVQIQAARLSLSATEKCSAWKSCERALQRDSLVNVKKTAHH